LTAAVGSAGFDSDRWRETLRRPDWYLTLQPEYEALFQRARAAADPAVAASIAVPIYEFFQERLACGEIVLGATGPAWDGQRMPIDTAVIHHTKLRPGVTWQRLDAIQLIRVYARYYTHPGAHERHIRGQPIHSGHLRDGRQVFYAYHWLVREDGSSERLLLDGETGWQAGDWNVNCRSVAIALDANLEHTSPPDAMLAEAARILREHYPDVAAGRVLGHREVNPRTTCPGGAFLGGWKRRLLEHRLIRES
jgi:hypothetical protein